MKFFQDDCIKILPKLRDIDLIITDPPYNIGWNYSSKVDDKKKTVRIPHPASYGEYNMKEKKCKACFGYGFWSWGHIAPMGPMDASDGVPTTKCPECGANPNPSNNEERYKEIKEAYDKGLLRFGETTGDEFQETWKKINKGKYI